MAQALTVISNNSEDAINLGRFVPHSHIENHGLAIGLTWGLFTPHLTIA